MIKDRGTKKWVAMMLPEHVAAVKEELLNEKKIKKPELDQEKLNDIDLLIHEEWNIIYFCNFHYLKMDLSKQ